MLTFISIIAKSSFNEDIDDVDANESFDEYDPAQLGLSQATSEYFM